MKAAGTQCLLESDKARGVFFRQSSTAAAESFQNHVNLTRFDLVAVAFAPRFNEVCERTQTLRNCALGIRTLRKLRPKGNFARVLSDGIDRRGRGR